MSGLRPPEDDENPFRAARTRAGLTQTQVASKLGVRPATVVAWEQGARPQPKTLERIAQLYGVDTAELRYAVDTAAAEGEPEEPVDAEGFTEGELGEMRGRLATTVEWMHALSDQVGSFATSVRGVEDSLRSLQRSLSRATTGVARVVSSGALGKLTEGERLALVIHEASGRGRDRTTMRDADAADADRPAVGSSG